MDQQPGVEQGEREHAQQQRPQHGALDPGVEEAPFVEDGRRLVEGSPPVHRQVDDGHVEEGGDGHDRRPSRPHQGIGRDPPHRQVPQVEDEEHGGAGQAGVPGPPHSPGGAAPDRSHGQGEADEQDPDLGRRTGHQVPHARAGAGPEIEHAGEGRDAERHVHGQPGGGRVEVEQAHRILLVHVGRGDDEGQPGGEAQAEQSGHPEDAGSSRCGGHASSRRGPKATTPNTL